MDRISCIGKWRRNKTIYSWNVIEYNFPNDNIRNTLISNGDYIEENNMPNGMQIWNDKVFITIPRWKNGVPSNLNFFLKNDESESPKLNLIQLGNERY